MGAWGWLEEFANSVCQNQMLEILTGGQGSDEAPFKLGQKLFGVWGGNSFSLVGGLAGLDRENP